MNDKTMGLTLLMADDDEEDRLLARDALRGGGLAGDVRFVEDGEELMDYLCRRGSYAPPAHAPTPGLVLLDLNMPRKDGREALAEIKSDPRLCRIPVVVLTTSKRDEDIQRSYLAGANSFIVKPVSFEGLVGVMRGLEQYWLELVTRPAVELPVVSTAAPIRVLLIDDDEDEFLLTRHHLAEVDAEGFAVDWAPDYETGLEAMDAQQHDVYLVDYRLGGRSGLDLLQEAREATRDRSVIVLTGVGNREVDLEAMRLGATSYLTKAELDGRILERTIRYTLELQRARADQRRAAERLRRHGDQQALLAELGRCALAADSATVVHEAARVVAEGMQVDGATFFETRLNESDLVLAACHGWPELDMGSLTVDVAVWPGTALHVPTPVVVGAGTAIAPALARLDVVGGVSARVFGHERALGVLVAFVRGTNGRELIGGDVTFLETAAQVLAQALDRNRAIEEQGRLQERLRRSEVMSAMGALVAGVAHETRNPLFGITATLDAITSRFGSQPELGRYIGVLQAETHRLSLLMTDLMEYGRPRSPEMTVGSLASVVAEAVRACGVLAERAEVLILDRVGQDLPALEMDAQRLVHAFQNVIQNAIQHSPRGATVTIDAAPALGERGAGLVCRIADGGPGFAGKDLGRVFEPFFTRRKGGTGLGLAIVERIVEEHGGVVAAANGSPGAVVTIELPIAGALA